MWKFYNLVETLKYHFVSGIQNEFQSNMREYIEIKTLTKIEFVFMTTKSLKHFIIIIIKKFFGVELPSWSV